jgi:hypothetical protein
MSEAEDAERAVEDLFNEEILGLKEPDRDEAPFPTEAPPESKPVEEIADPDEAPETTEEETPAPGEETTPEFPPQEEPAAEEPQEEPYLTWAKKKYSLADEQLENEATRLLARSNYEQEQLLGRKAQEEKLREEERRRESLQRDIDRLHVYGVLTPEEEAWVEERAMEGDLDEAAKACFDHGRYDLYAALTDRFVAMGGAAAQYANARRSGYIQDTVAFYQQPEASPQEQQRQMFRSAFASVGLDLDAHGPTVLAKAQELGGHYALALENGDEGQRAVAARALFDLAVATQTEVSRHRLDDVVQQRVQEEKLRQGASGVTQGGARVEQKKKDPFWDSYNEEIEERGWDGNRPSYGRE